VNYAEEQRNPTRHVVGLGVVIVMHIVLGWALLNGLARKVVEVVKGPIETKIIEEVKPPPPPPPENLPPPPKLAPPPPSFMPPPEVQIQNPPPAPAITVQREVPPPAPPVTIAPAAPVEAPPAPPAPPAAPVRVAPQINFNTDCEKPAYPAAAARAEATGVVRIKVTVGADGHATATEITRSSGNSREHKLLDRAAEAAIRNTCKFKPGTVDGKPEPLTTFVEYAWRLE
jgi:periplasmic protein TonB